MLFLSCAWALEVPSNEYPTLQQAVAAASDGDTINVAPGYEPGVEVVSISKRLEIRSNDGTIAPVEALEIKAEVTLYDLEIAAHSDGHLIVKNRLVGSNIHFATSSDTKLVAEDQVEISGMVIEGHEAGDDSHVAAQISNAVELTDCILRDSEGEAGFELSNGSALTLTGCTVENNAFDTSPILGTEAQVTITDSLFRGNSGSSEQHGGAITVTGGTLDVLQSRFENNSSPFKGGDIWITNTPTKIDFFESHQASSKRGASIYLDGGGATLEIKNGRFTNAKPSASATIYAQGGGGIDIERTWFCATEVGEHAFENSATEIRLSGNTALKLENVIISAGQGDAHASIYSNSTGPLRLDHVTAHAGAIDTLISGNAPGLEFFNTISDGYEPVVVVIQGNFSGSHNLLHSEAPFMQTDSSGDPLAEADASWLGVDPGFDNWDTSGCSDLPMLTSQSKALGQGSDQNWNGAPSDIGALSGPGSELIFIWSFEEEIPDTGGPDPDTGDPTPDSGEPDSHPPDDDDSDPPHVSFGPSSGGCASTGMAFSLAGLTLLALGAVRRRPDSLL